MYFFLIYIFRGLFNPFFFNFTYITICLATLLSLALEFNFFFLLATIFCFFLKYFFRLTNEIFISRILYGGLYLGIQKFLILFFYPKCICLFEYQPSTLLGFSLLFFFSFLLFPPSYLYMYSRKNNKNNNGGRENLYVYFLLCEKVYGYIRYMYVSVYL